MGAILELTSYAATRLAWSPSSFWARRLISPLVGSSPTRISSSISAVIMRGAPAKCRCAAFFLFVAGRRAQSAQLFSLVGFSLARTYVC